MLVNGPVFIKYFLQIFPFFQTFMLWSYKGDKIFIVHAKSLFLPLGILVHFMGTISFSVVIYIFIFCLFFEFFVWNWFGRGWNCFFLSNLFLFKLDFLVLCFVVNKNGHHVILWTYWFFFSCLNFVFCFLKKVEFLKIWQIELTINSFHENVWV